jgi:hypothetical protein
MFKKLHSRAEPRGFTGVAVAIITATIGIGFGLYLGGRSLYERFRSESDEEKAARLESALRARDTTRKR